MSEKDFPEELFLKINREEKFARESSNEIVRSSAKEGDDLAIDSFGRLVNLSEDESYPESYRDLSVEELEKKIESLIGRAFSYVYCYLPGRHGWDVELTEERQRPYKHQLERVKYFGQKYYEYSYNNNDKEEDRRLWFRKQLWIIEDECENMC